MQKQFVLLTALLLFFAAGVYAQRIEEKLVTVGIRAGANLQKIYGDDFLGKKLEYDWQPGFHAGLTADLLVSELFYLQPGLFYTTKGAQKNNGDVKQTQTLSYIELPLNLLLKPRLGGGKLLVGAGPYVAYGIAGKNKIKSGNAAIELDAVFKEKITAVEYASAFLNSAYFVKPWDFGGNVLLGYELKSGFLLQLNGQAGLYKINPRVEGVEADKSKWSNIGVGASIGFKF